MREDGSALFQLRDDKPGLRHAGMWVPPGGHCEPGESIEACARREFREETGYECDELHMLLSFLDDHVEGWPAYPITFFWAHFDGVQSLRCLEGQDLQFIERHSASAYPIPEYLVEIWDYAIASLKDHFRIS